MMYWKKENKEIPLGIGRFRAVRISLRLDGSY
jgi:hypothetical protein